MDETLYKDIYGNPMEIGRVYRNEVLKGTLSDHQNLWVVEEVTPSWIQERNLSHNSGSLRIPPKTFNDRNICGYKPMERPELEQLLGALEFVSGNIQEFLK